ncbi:bifunctional lytic transglycosylase/C40 family peptidase [Yinghuangia sp. ASG 101]|uniref:C40 family peptidase n=1 Tax=Yinghuangia sp. ASG 101 TaxID=2896848 RepID=UPI001E52FEFF|nr:bifunctional lytic transglycosylase/C40 family peptidase [Yinghuangia sp. ASG 101]UGQ13601.1 bifunctional lytic transglycosylase/C40 family peptidase [Yinghuangia sp. ASG 101]
MKALRVAASGCLAAVLLGLAVLAALITLVVKVALLPLGVFGGAGTDSAAGAAAPSASALADIPPGYLSLYQQAAATCPGLPWTVLAAIGKVESDHGRAPSLVSSAGALGPMQFLPATWTSYGAGGDIWNPNDAIPAAARYLCASGARDGKDMRGAVFAYNHAGWYVDNVLAQAAAYTAPAPATNTAPGAPGSAAQTAIAFAQAAIGTPYLWGGDGPVEGGFDCSGLTKAAYAAAGVTLPRVAQDQYAAGPQVPYGAPLMPGDLVFYGTASNIHHVGLYVGDGKMIDAPFTGALVRLERFRWVGDDYYGATRPGNQKVSP